MQVVVVASLQANCFSSAPLVQNTCPHGDTLLTIKHELLVEPHAGFHSETNGDVSHGLHVVLHT